jgi:4'-phosphopantetheinyl transferase EntD
VQGRLSAGQAEALAAQIATADERRRLGAHFDLCGSITLLWTLKESVYKALSRRIETPCGFDDVELLDFSIDTGEARLRLRRALGAGLHAGSAHSARALARRRHVLSLCVLRAAQESEIDDDAVTRGACSRTLAMKSRM